MDIYERIAADAASQLVRDTSLVLIGTSYRLTADRGSATVTEIVDRFRVIVRFSDGGTRKVSVSSLESVASGATASPKPVARGGRSGRQDEYAFREMKSAINGEYAA